MKLNSCRFAAAVLLFAAASCTAGENKRVLLLGQKPDGHPPGTHEYMAGQRLLADCLRGVPKIECQVVQADSPWEDGPKLVDRADAIVLFVSEGAKWLQESEPRYQAFQRAAERGAGLVVLHWGMGTREAGPIDGFVKLFGGCHGGPDRKYQVLDAATIHVADRSHPIVRGIGELTVPEEFYYRLKFARPVESVKPLLQVSIDGSPETVAWTWDRPGGGRSFGFSGLHFHSNWNRAEYRRLIAQAVLWSLGMPIPEQGLDVPALTTDGAGSGR